MATSVQISASLSQPGVPILSRQVKLPVIIGKYDINFLKQAGGNEADSDKDTTLPMASFAKNVLPTSNGYKSCGFVSCIDAIHPQQIIQCAIPISLGTGEVYIYAYGTNDTDSSKNGHWVAKQEPDKSIVWEHLLEESLVFGADTDKLISSAIINGRCFLFFEKLKCMELTAGAIADVTLSGLTETNIIGIIESSGYLLAWDEVTVYRSSLTNPLDFVPSDITGAGSSAIQELRGKLKLLKTTTDGFIAYSDLNAVYAQYSADFREPWIFRGIDNIAGIASKVNSVNSGAVQTHYVHSGSMFAKINKKQVTPVLPELTDALKLRYIEDYDDVTGQIVEDALSEVDVKISAITGGLILFAYKDKNKTSYDNIIVYNSQLNRYGKLFLPHAYSCFWPFDTTVIYNNYRFFQEDDFNDHTTETILDLAGFVADINYNSVISLFTLDGRGVVIYDALASFDAALILGPFQFTRNMGCMVTTVIVKVATAATVDCAVLTSYDGDTVERKTILHKKQAGKLVIFSGRVTGTNHRIALTGSFDLSSVVITAIPTHQLR